MFNLTYGLLEGASHETADLLSIDAVTRDRHEVALGGHDVAEKRQVAIVDIGAVEGDDVVHLFLDGLAAGLDAERLEHLDDVVRVGAHRVDVLGAEHLHERGAVRLEHPLGDGLELAVVVDLDALLLLLDRLRHVHLDYGLDALQRHVGQDVLLEQLEELIVLHLVRALATVLAAAILAAADAATATLVRIVHDSDAEYELLGVVVVEYAVEIVAEVVGDLLGDVLHGELLVGHALAIELDAEQPVAESALVEVGHLVVDVHPLLVLGNARLLRVGIVVDGGVGGDLAEGGVLELTQHVLALLGVLGRWALEEDDERGRLGLLAHVDDLLETRHAERHVLGRHAGVMERVECHLSGGLAERLGGERADHLARLHLGLLEARLDLANEPVERLLAQLVLLGDATRAQVRAQQDVHQERGVRLRLATQPIFAGHHHQLGAQRAHRLDDLHRVEIDGLAQVDAERLLRVHDQPLDVARQDDAHVAERKELAYLLAIAAQLPILVLEHGQVARIGHQALDDVLGEEAAQVALVGRVEVPRLLELLVGDLVERHALELDHLAGEAVLAVAQLDEVVHRVAHRAVVLDHDALHGLDEATLDVASLGGLHGRVDETFTTAHGVEEELAGCEADEVGVLDETFGLRRVVVLDEVRQGAMLEAEGYALALDVLLADAGDHLRDVDLGALGAGVHHRLEVVERGEKLLGGRAGLVARLVEDLVHLVLERLTERVARRGHELVVVRLLDHVEHALLGLLDRVLDARVRLRVGDGVADADRVALDEQPVVDHRLNVAVEFAALFVAVLHEDQVEQRAGRRAQRLLAQDARDQLAVVHNHLFYKRINVFIF